MKIELPNINCVAFDIGETVGVAEYLFRKLRVDQYHYEEFMGNYLEGDVPWEICIIESYRVYKHKALAQINNQELTSQIIGMARKTMESLGVKVVMQSASQAKGLCTNDLLKEYGFYTPGKKHGNDSARHILYYLLTHREEK